MTSINRKTVLIVSLILLGILVSFSGCTQTQAQPQNVTDQMGQTGQGQQSAAAMDGVKEGDSVGIYYILTLDDGTIFEQCTAGNNTPLTFVVGKHSVVKGLEDALYGMKVGETKTVHLTPDLAYGEYKPSNVITVNSSSFGENASIVVGTTVYISANNIVCPAVIRGVSGDTVLLDLNHRLVGQNLTFEVTLDSINK